MAEDPKLDKITDSLVHHLRAEVEKGTSDGNTPLEAILKTSPKKNRPSKKAPQILDLGGFHIYNDPMTLLFFRLVQLNHPDVDKILTEGNFNMVDVAGSPIFPRPQINAPTEPQPKS